MTIRMTVTGLACALALGACASTDETAMTEEVMAEEMMAEEAMDAATEEAMAEADAMMAEEEVVAAIEATGVPTIEPMETMAVETATVETTIVEEPLEAAAAPAAAPEAATTEAPADIRLCIKMGGQVNFRSTADGDFYQVCQMEDGGEIATETLYTVELANRGEEAMEAFLAE